MGNWSIAENCNTPHVFLPHVDAGRRENATVKSPGQTEIDDNPRVAKKAFFTRRSAGLTILTTLKRN